MTVNAAFKRATLIAILGAFVVAACGGTSPTAAPTNAPVTAPPQTFAPTPEPLPSATPVVTAEPTEAAVDPADDLEIAAPYTLESLDEALADVFVTAMKGSMGPMADLVQVGVRTAVKDGDDAAWVIVMDIPGVPMTGTTFLDAAAAGAAGEGGVEKRDILDHPTRIIESGGFIAVVMIIDDELVMVMAADRAASVAAATAVIKANP